LSAFITAPEEVRTALTKDYPRVYSSEV